MKTTIVHRRLEIFSALFLGNFFLDRRSNEIIDCYNLKNKINELTAVIVKLEAIEKPLLEKLQSVITINA